MNPAPSSQAIVYVYYFLLFTNCPSLIQVNLDKKNHLLRPKMGCWASTESEIRLILIYLMTHQVGIFIAAHLHSRLY